MPLFEVGVSIKSNKYKVFPQSILVSKLNPETKRVWLPFTNNDRAICSTEFMQFVPRDKEKRAFLYYLLASDKMQEEILMRVTGSTGSRQRAQPSLIATLPVVVPKEKLQTLYSILTFPQLIMINKLQVESKHLAEIRDSLLPKLISGEIEVPVEVGA
jgi:type I restriction enzyme S subunit